MLMLLKLDIVFFPVRMQIKADTIRLFCLLEKNTLIFYYKAVFQPSKLTKYPFPSTENYFWGLKRNLSKFHSKKL